MVPVTRRKRSGLTCGPLLRAIWSVENPYQPPHETGAPESSLLRPGLYPLARLANKSLRLYLVTTAYVVVDHLYRTFVGGHTSQELSGPGMKPSQVVAILLVIVNWASFILFLVWKYRAAANARVLDSQAMRLSPAMAVVGYFIPLANLALPCMAMAGITRASRVESIWCLMWALCYVGFFLLIPVTLLYSVEVVQGGSDGGETPDLFINHLYAFWSVLMYFFAWQIMMRVTRAQMIAEDSTKEVIPA